MLTGKKVVLRAFEKADFKLLHNWQNDEEVMRLARSSPDHVISMAALEGKYEKFLKGDDLLDRGYIIEERESKRPISWASITIHQWSKRATAADVGLAIGERDSWRRGYGVETVDLLLKESFELLNFSPGRMVDLRRQRGERGACKEDGLQGGRPSARLGVFRQQIP